MTDEENTFGSSDFEIVETKGFINNFKNSRVLISNLLFSVDMALDLVEKLRKLIYWEDQKSSTIVLVVLLLAFFVVTFIPLRWIIVIALIGKFNKGSKYYRRRNMGNRETCRIELRNFLFNEKLYTFDILFGDETIWLGKPWPGNKSHLLKLKEHF